jgi:hypothetical protein
MNASTFPKRFDRFLDAIQAILMSCLVKLGPFFVALMPALFTAYSIFHTFRDEAGDYLALFFAGVVGVAIETVGIVATHTAIDLYNAKQQAIIEPVKFQVMAWLVPTYVIGVAAVVGFSEDAFTPLVKSLGIASPFLTCIVYIAVALARDLSRIETKQAVIDERQATIEDEDRQWQRDKERLELEMKHQERLAKIQSLTVNQPVAQPVNQTNQTVQEAVKNHVFDAVNLSKIERKTQLLERLVDIYMDDPDAKVSTIANTLKVSRQTVYNYLDELAQAGRIGRNGKGIEAAR